MTKAQKERRADPAAALGREANRLIDLIEADRSKFDVSIHNLIKAVGKPTTILDHSNGATTPGQAVSCTTCTSAGCCYQLVFASLHDALPLARWLIRTGKATPQFIQELRTVGEAQEAVGREAWFDQSIPCVFLKTTEAGGVSGKQCTIYPYRPHACKAHLVISPPERCSPPTRPDADIGGVHSAELDQLFAQQSAMIMQALHLRPVNRWGEEKTYAAALPKMLAIVLEGLLGEEDFNEYLEEQTYLTTDVAVHGRIALGRRRRP